MKKSPKKTKKQDLISPSFDKYVKKELNFDEVLSICTPLFKSFAIKTHDNAEALSRMSRNLYRLLKSYNTKKGNGLQMIYKMCKNILIDMHKEAQRKSYIIFVEDSSQLMEYHCSDEFQVQPYDIDKLDNADEIKDKLAKIIKESNLRKSQKDKYDRGVVQPIKHKGNIESIKAAILEDGVLYQYVSTMYNLEEDK